MLLGNVGHVHPDYPRRRSTGAGADQGDDRGGRQDGAEDLAARAEAEGGAVEDQHQTGEAPGAGQAAEAGTAPGAGEIGAAAAAEEAGEHLVGSALLGQVQPGLAGSLVDQQQPAGRRRRPAPPRCRSAGRRVARAGAPRPGRGRAAPPGCSPGHPVGVPRTPPGAHVSGRLPAGAWRDPWPSLRSKMMRRPCRVSQGSWRSMVSQTPIITAARPPVAITVAWSPSSAIIRRTSASTCPAKPKTMPAWSDSAVFLPITERGATSSTRRSWAVSRTSASVEISIPGAIATPSISPRRETASKVVAVPKSTTTDGPPYNA